jgi:hypothetical protein
MRYFFYRLLFIKQERLFLATKQTGGLAAAEPQGDAHMGAPEQRRGRSGVRRRPVPTGMMRPLQPSRDAISARAYNPAYLHGRAPAVTAPGLSCLGSPFPPSPRTSAPGLHGLAPFPHLHWDWAHPRPHLRRDWAHPCPHLHWDWAHPFPHLHWDWAHPRPHLRRDWMGGRTRSLRRSIRNTPRVPHRSATLHRAHTHPHANTRYAHTHTRTHRHAHAHTRGPIESENIRTNREIQGVLSVLVGYSTDARVLKG